MSSSVHHAIRYTSPQDVISATTLPTTQQRPKRTKFGYDVWLGGVSGAVTSTFVAATYLCETAKDLNYNNSPSCKISLPNGNDWVRRVPDFVPQAMAKLLPETLYLTHRLDKLADYTAMAHGLVFRGYSWGSMHALLVRLPQAPYPYDICDPKSGTAGCPAKLLYDVADTFGARNAVVWSIVTGILLGALIGSLVTLYVVPLTRNIPDGWLPAKDWKFSDVTDYPATHWQWPKYVHQNVGSVLKVFKREAQARELNETTPLIADQNV